jgi:hypothetical protein
VKQETVILSLSLYGGESWECEVTVRRRAFVDGARREITATRWGSSKRTGFAGALIAVWRAWRTAARWADALTREDRHRDDE